MTKRRRAMSNHLLRFALASTVVLTLGGCATDAPGPATSSVTLGAAPFTRGNLGTLTYRAVDLILAAAPEVTASTPIIVTSVSDAQRLNISSPLGNIVSDMIRTRLVQDGHYAHEVRLRNTIELDRNEGEFLLSRNRRALMPPPSKLVAAADAHIISGADFVVSLRDIVGLLGHT
jgi:hypothetical protein